MREGSGCANRNNHMIDVGRHVVSEAARSIVAFTRLDVRCLDVRHTATPAFKCINVGQVAKSRRYSSEPHDLRTAWAKRDLRRVFIGEFVTHGQSGPEPRCPTP